MINENIHYRLPLKLINSYSWARLNYPGRAILPVMGIHIDLRNNQARPGIELISKLSGYSNLGFVRAGINDLINHNLIIRQKEGRHYVYSLTGLSFCKHGSGYLPIYKGAMILSRKWAGLTPSEKSLYPVMGNKARINDPEAEDSGFYAIGNIYEINKYIEWAGISRSSFYRAYKGLNRKGLIGFWGDEDFCRYGIYVPQYCCAKSAPY
ncbi:hypothetical protein ES695_12655 [Candidatus Atribacteria bacterium 1244-E10-H5-B2]|nr:MAG: hypothetical protein ES695_12655 [Candidatus Atribacteria bacterium 1244-E10-H5-B2]